MREAAHTEELQTAQQTPRTLEQALSLLKRRERELAALRAAQQEWVHAVSHDLRAPLRHVLSFGPLVEELLQSGPLAGAELDEARSFVQTMDQSARRMGAMFDGLLQLSRAARQPLQWQPVELGTLLQRLTHELQRSPDMAGRSVQWQLPASHCVVRADAQLLQQALQAVLANAVKFTRPVSAARIAVEVRREATGRVRVTVADNGVGFDAARAAGLFGIFQRMHRETEFEGIGAGLALVRQVCRRHGGDAGIQAQPGQGCRVSLYWQEAGEI